MGDNLLVKANFKYEQNGSGEYIFEWLNETNDIIANTKNLVLNNVKLSDSGVYTLRVTDLADKSFYEEETFELEVVDISVPLPSEVNTGGYKYILNPQLWDNLSTPIPPSGNYDLDKLDSVINRTEVKYQWYRNNEIITDSLDSTYGKTEKFEVDAEKGHKNEDAYHVVVIYPCNGIELEFASNPCIVNFYNLELGTIDRQYLKPTQTAHFKAVISNYGSGDLSYKWYKSTESNKILSEESILTVANLQFTDEGEYILEVTDNKVQLNVENPVSVKTTYSLPVSIICMI